MAYQPSVGRGGRTRIQQRFQPACRTIDEERSNSCLSREQCVSLSRDIEKIYSKGEEAVERGDAIKNFSPAGSLFTAGLKRLWSLNRRASNTLP